MLGCGLDFIDATELKKQRNEKTQRTESGARAGCVSEKGHGTPSSHVAECLEPMAWGRVSVVPFYSGAGTAVDEPAAATPARPQRDTETCTPVTKMQQRNSEEASDTAFKRQNRYLQDSWPLPG